MNLGAVAPDASRSNETHPTASKLILALDAELPEHEVTAIEDHLFSCDACRHVYRELGGIAIRLESLVAEVPVASGSAAAEARDFLIKDLGRQRSSAALTRPLAAPAVPASHAFWSLAVAAGLALCISLMPQQTNWHVSQTSSVKGAAGAGSAPRTFEAVGETFVALPYSNSELPLTSQIVQMKVPAASLNQAGVIVEPFSTVAANPNGSVLADVLLGLDGEPLGVHVVEVN